MSRIDDKIIDVTRDVKWIGVLDYDIRTFDIVMHTNHGTTYNSYFVNAEKKAIIDVTKEKFSETYLGKLRSVTNPEEIQYIILDHTEPDHSGSLRLLKLKIFEETAAFKFSPGGSKEEFLKDFGRKFAQKFMEEYDQIKNPGN